MTTLTKIEVTHISGSVFTKEVHPSRTFEMLNHYRNRADFRSARIVPAA